MGALFIAHSWMPIISILEFYMVKPDVETVIAYLYSKYNRSQMMSVDTLLCMGAYLIRQCAIETILERI